MAAPLPNADDAVAQLIAAWDTVLALYRAGGGLQLRGQSLYPVNITDPALLERIDTSHDAIVKLLQGRLKAWAGEMEEVVLVMSPGTTVTWPLTFPTLTAVPVHRRQNLGIPTDFDLSSDDQRLALKDLLDEATGIVLPDVSRDTWEAAVLALSAIGIFLKDLRVTAVQQPADTDFGAYLAGSDWVRFAHHIDRSNRLELALLTSFQLRSIRRTEHLELSAIELLQRGVARLNRSGATADQICEALGLSARFVSRSIQIFSRTAHPGPVDEASASLTPVDDDPITEGQKKYLFALLKRYPEFRPLIPGDDRDVTRLSKSIASEVISAITEILAGLAPDARLAAQEDELRRRLQAGETLMSASRDVGLSDSAARVLLESDRLDRPENTPKQRSDRVRAALTARS